MQEYEILTNYKAFVFYKINNIFNNNIHCTYT